MNGPGATIWRVMTQPTGRKLSETGLWRPEPGNWSRNSSIQAASRQQSRGTYEQRICVQDLLQSVYQPDDQLILGRGGDHCQRDAASCPGYGDLHDLRRLGVDAGCKIQCGDRYRRKLATD